MDIAFNGIPFDRADARRAEAGLLDKRLDTGCHSIVFLQDQVLSDADGRPVWLDGACLKELKTGHAVFLGVDAQDVLHFGARLQQDNKADSAQLAEAIQPGSKWRDLRSVAMKLGPSAPILGAVAHAKSVLDWHDRHQFCAVCGHETDAVNAGAYRQCPACGASHFPRTDPVVIMLIQHGETILLGRGPKFPPGFYSALAGFVEPGESLEEAVARESWEEAGVRITDVTYKASQPWPWPSSLMIGCFAWAESPEVQLMSPEVDAVRWIDRTEARAALAGQIPDFFLPPPIAIAHNLIQMWLDES